jgi:hypothetical protein
MDERTANDRDLGEERGLAAQWVGLLLAPAAFFAHLQLAYAIVPLACRDDNDLWIHVSGVASVVLAAIGTFVAWRAWHRAGGGPPGDGGGVEPRARFLGVTGLGVSAILTLILAAQWVAAFIISPCQ